MPSYFYYILFELYSPNSPYCSQSLELTGLSQDQLASLPASIPPPGTDIFATDLPSHSEEDQSSTSSTTAFQHTRKDSKSKEKEPISDPHPDYRFGRISVESLNMPTKRVSSLVADGAASRAHFTPIKTQNTEFGFGVVHLYRDANETPGLYEQDSPSSSKDISVKDQELDEEALKTVAILAVPSYMAASDFMGFVGEETKAAVSHLRMVRTGKANRYMVLMKFRNKGGAHKFVTDFNGKAFNSMEPESCHVVYVKHVQFSSPSKPLMSQAHLPPGIFPELCNDPFSPSKTPNAPGINVATSSAVQLTAKPAPPPTPSLLELPTCPVCLERMDETTGLLTILCQHVFHCACLSKWKDSSCPVCRYTQSADLGGGSEDTDSEENDTCATCGSPDNNWICLICGNVGCGRYDEAHAFAHYEATSHSYAMDIESQRIWDYVGDGYVHRLVQNKADGKLVDLPPINSQEDEDLIPRAKIEEIGLEYTYLLSSQLESQRQYFEEQVARAAGKASTAQASAEKAAAEASAVMAVLNSAETKLESLEKLVPQLEKARDRAETKAQKSQEMARTFQKEWKDEKVVNEGLLEKVQFLTKQGEEQAAEIAELKDQVRDLMFFLQARDKMEGAGEDVQEGTVTVAEAPKETGKGKKKKKGKK